MNYKDRYLHHQFFNVQPVAKVETWEFSGTFLVASPSHP
jgi:hypothetical protein